MIGKLSELLISVNKSGYLDVGTNPRSPLDLKSPSPRGLKRYDIGGVGLGIVAALEKSGSDDSCNKHAICSSNLNRSEKNGVIVNSGKNCVRFSSCLEDYTFVTSHGVGKSSSTKVYYDGIQQISSSSSGHDRNRFGDVKEEVTYPTSDFLSHCQLCRKKLHGRDIYMYR